MSETNQPEYSTNIIHEELGDTTEFWGSYTFGELLLFALPLFAWLVIMGMPFVPSSAVVPATIGLIVVEVFLYVLHQVRPNYYRLTEWLRVRAFWLVKKRRTPTMKAIRIHGMLPASSGSCPTLSNALTVHTSALFRSVQQTWRWKTTNSGSRPSSR